MDPTSNPNYKKLEFLDSFGELYGELYVICSEYINPILNTKNLAEVEIEKLWPPQILNKISNHQKVKRYSNKEDKK